MIANLAGIITGGRTILNGVKGLEKYVKYGIAGEPKIVNIDTNSAIDVLLKDSEGSFLQRNARPIIAIGCFIMMVVDRLNLLPMPLRQEFYDIAMVYMCGYGALRSIEKIVQNLKG